MSLSSLIGPASVIDCLTPAADASGKTGAWLSMAGVGRVLVVVHIQQGNPATIALTLKQATDSSGSNAKALAQDVPIFTNLDTASSDTLTKQAQGVSYTTDADVKNKLVLFDISSTHLDMNASTPFTHLTITTGPSNSANITAATFIAYDLRF